MYIAIIIATMIVSAFSVMKLVLAIHGKKIVDIVESVILFASVATLIYNVF